MLKGLNFVAIISLMGWGLGYFGQPHILARFYGGGFSPQHCPCASYQYDLDDPLHRQGRWLSASLGLLTLMSTRR
ncbi:hypothetical protein ACP0HM_02015 [Escherichia coli]